MGGAENLAIQIANARAEAGDAAYLYVLTDANGPLADRVAPGVTVRALGLARAPIGSVGPFFGTVIGGYRRLAAQIRSDGVQVVQSHLPGANFWGLLLAERRVCAVAATIHNTREFDYGDADHPVRRRLRRAAYRRILRRCDAVVAVSARVRDSLLAELDVTPDEVRRFAVITNGVTVPPPCTPERRAAVRAAAGVAAGVPYVVGAGRLTPQKDFATLVAAAARLRDLGRPFHLVIGGEGELRPELTAQIAASDLAPTVRLPGNLTDLDDQLGAADLFVLSSRWEGLPLVLLEAMARGLPVVATRLDGLPELVEASGAGLLVAPGDDAALADAMAALLDDPQRRRDCGQCARATIERDYAFAQVSARLGALYGELSASRGARC